ncbi:unnamed protein product [Paramecium pentaurelia]|uniref:Crossover junction endonuclease MUS81 n=1 Tax=Paramecium pentaurelia TaxID=43138 RepID=A0A8S1RZT9_9CILI|nr:unnamed protein product [Paramecium pentaurelia]
MPKQLIKSKNPHNQFIADHIVELKNRCLRTGQDKLAFIYQKIIQSLQKYPMPLLCEDQVQMLQGVGDKTSVMILQLIKKQYQQYEIPFHKFNEALIQDNLDVINEQEDDMDQIYSESCPPSMIYNDETSKRKDKQIQSSFIDELRKQVIKPGPDLQSKSKRQYQPGKNSKSGQVLMSLYKFQKSENKLFASKKQIKEQLREICNTELSSWNAIETLEKHQLIQKTVLDNEIKYALTEDGIKLGQQYFTETMIQQQMTVPSERPSKIILLIDNRERFQSNNRQIIFEKLTNIYQIECRLSQLPIGDFMWICQKGDDEYICDYIIERKTIQDLAHSILDKRYQVQKHKLKHCGINNRFYLVENSQSSNLPVPRATIDKAIRNTQIKDGFFIQQTETLEDSLRWLALFTKTVKLLPNAIKFSEFLYNNSKKAESLFNLWGSMLRGIHGVGLESAKAIACVWKTPIEFYDAINQDETKSLQQLIEENSIKQRSIPSHILRQIEILFQKEHYPN